MNELVHYAVEDGIGTVTLDSPGNRNALSRQLVTGLFDALSVARTDDSVVVLIRSADRVFCSGADLTEASTGGMEEGAHAIVRLQREILTLPKPVVVRLAGPVRAGGLGIVAGADIVVCARDVTFAFTEARLGLAPAVISLTVLARMTSRSATDTFLTGRVFDADEATDMGLVTRSVPAGDLDDEIARVCEDLRRAHPQGLAETKALLNRDIVTRIDGDADELASLSARLFASDGAREAMTAFLQHRG